jgi:hypothetical protein
MPSANFRKLKPGVQLDRTNREYDSYIGVLRHRGKILWRGSAHRISDGPGEPGFSHSVARRRVMECAESALRCADDSRMAEELQRLLTEYVEMIANRPK